MKENKATAYNPDIVQKSLIDFIDHVPGLSIRSVLHPPQSRSGAYQPDLILDLTLLPAEGEEGNIASVSQTWRLVFEVIRHASPSLLESASAMLLRYVNQAELEPTETPRVTVVPVLFVPYLNSTALGRCTHTGVNCVDMAGNGRIVFGNRLYIERMGQPDLRPRRDSIASLFVPKAERVLRVLLNAAGAEHRIWRVQPLAEEARVSIGQVARVKAALYERGFILEDSTVRRYGGFHLTHPEELLQEWATSVRSKRYRRGVDHTYNAVDSVGELKRMLCRKVPDRKDAVALSGLLAAERYAPYVVSSIFTAYVVENEAVDLGLIAEALDLQPVHDGINAVLTVPRDEGVLYLPEDIKAEFTSSLNSVQAVSPIQAYLDLQRLGGRAEEGAQHLLETYLRPRWQRN